MTQGLVGIATAMLGALLGALATYGTQRFFNRPRIYIEYAETRYQNSFSLSIDTQQDLLQYNAFLEFVNAQSGWDFGRLLIANSFNHDELLVLHNLCDLFKGQQDQILIRVDRLLAMIDEPLQHEELGAIANIAYIQNFQRPFFVDYHEDRDNTLLRVRAIFEGHKRQIQGTSKRNHQVALSYVFGVANRGLRDGILNTQAQLHWDGTTFKLPLLLSSRPWEGERKSSPYIPLETKGFIVLDFAMDDKLNAPADLEKLKNAAKKGAHVTIELRGAAGSVISRRRLSAELD